MQTVRRNGLDAGQTVKRACTGPGRERDLAVQAVKAAMAAWIAWAVAGWWLEAPVAFVAPWVAIVLVESTVYRSVAHGLQQLAAIASGTVAATAVALLLHDRMVAMALVLPCAVLLGQWRRLGSQGIYAATGALFVLTNPSVSIAASTARITEALFGAVVGIAVNALIRPPLYLRDTRAVLRDATHEAHDILEAVADGLADGRWDTDEADTWHARALRLQRLVDQARAAVGHSRESLRINIRSRTGTSGTASPPGKEYDDAVLVLEYAAVHTMRRHPYRPGSRGRGPGGHTARVRPHPPLRRLPAPDRPRAPPLQPQPFQPPGRSGAAAGRTRTPPDARRAAPPSLPGAAGRPWRSRRQRGSPDTGAPISSTNWSPRKPEPPARRRGRMGAREPLTPYVREPLAESFGRA